MQIGRAQVRSSAVRAESPISENIARTRCTCSPSPILNVDSHLSVSSSWPIALEIDAHRWCEPG